MKDRPLFSIIIPVYKIEKYIEECVDSIIKQEFYDFEIILVDDGSPDQCPMICDNLRDKDSRIRVIHKRNEGVSVARKDAAELAQGEYIICIDGDDWMGENCLNKIANVIKKTKADIVCYGMVYDNGKELFAMPLNQRAEYYSLEDINEEIYPILIQGCDAQYFPPGLCGKVIRKPLLLENILSNKLATIGEDGACVIPCIYNAKSLYILDEHFYYYRYNVESATKEKKVFNWDWPKIVAEHIKSKIDIQCSDFEEQIYRKITHDLFSVVITQFNRKESYHKIIKEIKRHLNEEIYNEAIDKCKFKDSYKAVAMEFVIKKRFFFPIYLYSKLRQKNSV